MCLVHFADESKFSLHSLMKAFALNDSSFSYLSNTTLRNQEFWASLRHSQALSSGRPIPLRPSELLQCRQQPGLAPWTLLPPRIATSHPGSRMPYFQIFQGWQELHSHPPPHHIKMQGLGSLLAFSVWGLTKASCNRGSDVGWKFFSQNGTFPTI